MSAASPEELDTLLEDAVLLHDDATLAGLFAYDVLVAAAGTAHVGVEAGALLAGYVGSAGPVRITHGLAVVVGDRAVTLSSRGADGRWRLLAVVLLSPGGAPS